MELSNIENFLKELPSTAIIIFIFLVLAILFYRIKNKNLPPGPWGLPLVGYWPYLKNKGAHKQLQALMKKYGEVYAFYVTGQLYIHLGSIKSIREAHLNKTDYFTSRSSSFSVVTCFFEEGVVGANGEQWKLTRKFFIQMFREYGLSSSKDMSSSIYDSVSTAIDKIRDVKGTPVDIMSILAVHCSTVLRRILFNDDGITTEELMELTEAYERVIDVFFDKNIFLAGNVAKYLVLPFNATYKNSVKNYKKVDSILKNIVKRHVDTLDEQNIRNVIDSFYKERNDRKAKNDPTSKYFTDKALTSSLLQFLGDGVLGIAAYITFFVYALLEYPDEQEKIYKELNEVLGPNRQPSLEDKNILPYTNAFILEVARTSDLVTVLPSLECTKETTLNGYRIPKGAVTVVNFWAAHHDPNVYEDPDMFKPSRFLKEPGKEKAESPILFGVGKRSCVGESFTMAQTFLFISTLVKNFKLELPEGASNKSFLEGKMLVIANPRISK